MLERPANKHLSKHTARPTPPHDASAPVADENLSLSDWQRYGALGIVFLQTLAWCSTQTSAGWGVQLLWLGSLVIELVLLNAIISSLARQGLAQHQTARHWQTLADTDSLTGLFNRRYLDREIEAACLRAQRDGGCLSVLMVDIDHFKCFNDTYGHPQGDDCLRRVASVLRRRAQRWTDMACRYGGEEFAIVLPHCDRHAARLFATQLCDDVRGLGIAHAGAAQGRVSVSVGIACLHTESPARGSDLLRLADEALYDAKRAGRDTVRDAW